MESAEVESVKVSFVQSGCYKIMAKWVFANPLLQKSSLDGFLPYSLL